MKTIIFTILMSVLLTVSHLAVSGEKDTATSQETTSTHNFTDDQKSMILDKLISRESLPISFTDENGEEFTAYACGDKCKRDSDCLGKCECWGAYPNARCIRP